ncbi:LacI family DNA-binding transcriptional regulator [Myceligenerans sp. I2]|uniref:LacI family DNA-binding transcriptional regulator n=2 Tax=Myceligenerans indicum TaxID=2593663 RepID=A0ABS1LKT2_9MICO|nr:LacI family DNA-binding transcriptional regulator [Myceligenerans indicum]
MSDVAARAGVSHQTVSRVLNGSPRVAPETRERVLQAIHELGYRRNVAARALVTSRSTTLGVITTSSVLYGPTSTLIAVEEAAREQGWFTSVATIGSYDAESVDRVLEHFMSQAVEGVVVIAPQEDVGRAVDAFDAPIPVVLIAARESAVERTIPLAVDQGVGAGLAVGHLLDLGHETVLHVAGPPDWFDARQRVAGWRAALERRGAPVPEPVVADWSAGRGYDVGRGLAERIVAGDGPTAVFAANDQLALGLARAFWEAGLRVPEDVSLVGFDDIQGADQFIPPLTTVRQPFAELGRRSVELLFDAVAGRSPSGALIAPELVVRASTAPPR